MFLFLNLYVSFNFEIKFQRVLPNGDFSRKYSISDNTIFRQIFANVDFSHKYFWQRLKRGLEAIVNICPLPTCPPWGYFGLKTINVTIFLSDLLFVLVPTLE